MREETEASMSTPDRIDTILDEMTLDMRGLAYFGDGRNAWVADAGDFELLIGTSSVDLPRTASLQLERECPQPASGARTTGEGCLSRPCSGSKGNLRR